MPIFIPVTGVLILPTYGFAYGSQDNPTQNIWYPLLTLTNVEILGVYHTHDKGTTLDIGTRYTLDGTIITNADASVSSGSSRYDSLFPTTSAPSSIYSQTPMGFAEAGLSPTSGGNVHAGVPVKCKSFKYELRRTDAGDWTGKKIYASVQYLQY